MARRVPRQRTSVRSSKASYLEIVCPNHEAALALVSTARRLGITAKPRKLRSSDASPCAIPTHRTYAHSYWCAALRTRVDRKAFRRRSSGQSQPSGQLRRRQHASQRQAAAEACDKVRQALRFLEMTFQTTSNRPASFVSTMLMRRWNSWDVGRSTNHQGCHRGPYPSTSAARRENRKSAPPVGLIESFMQNTMPVFEQHGVFVRLGLYYA